MRDAVLLLVALAAVATFDAWLVARYANHADRLTTDAAPASSHPDEPPP